MNVHPVCNPCHLALKFESYLTTMDITLFQHTLISQLFCTVHWQSYTSFVRLQQSVQTEFYFFVLDSGPPMGVAL